MAKRPPQKNSVEWVPIPDAPDEYKDVLIGIRYVGDESLEWAQRHESIFDEERVRTDKLSARDIDVVLNEVREALKGKLELEPSNEVIQHVLERMEVRSSAKAGAEFVQLANDVFKRVVAGVRGLEGVNEDDAKEAINLIEYLSAHRQMYSVAQCQQSLKLREYFRSTMSRGV